MFNETVSVEIFSTYDGMKGLFPSIILGGCEPDCDSVERRIAKHVIALRELDAGQYIAEWTHECGRRSYVFTVEREDVTITHCRIKVA